jgi:hypothetical protein
MKCCDIKNDSNTKVSCPVCHAEGSPVETITLRSLVKAEFQVLIHDDPYRYCKTQTCSVVYFCDQKVFNVDQLAVKVMHKDLGLDVKLCYCFNITRTDIKKDSDVLETIKRKMKDPGCFCERSNPQGSCCLGNVSAYKSLLSKS